MTTFQIILWMAAVYFTFLHLFHWMANQPPPPKPVQEAGIPLWMTVTWPIWLAIVLIVSIIDTIRMKSKDKNGR